MLVTKSSWVTSPHIDYLTLHSTDFSKYLFLLSVVPSTVFTVVLFFMLLSFFFVALICFFYRLLSDIFFFVFGFWLFLFIFFLLLFPVILVFRILLTLL